MDREELRRALEASPSLATFFSMQVLDAVPWIFRGDVDLYRAWKQDVADAAGVTSDAIVLVGSAAVGYSLSPFKAGRDFRPVLDGEDPPSDIDVAVIDSDLFTKAWNDLVRSDRHRSLWRIVGRSGGRATIPEAIAKMRQDVYFGAVASNYALPGSESASRVRTLLSAVTRRNPFRGHPPRARLYRRRDDLLAYHEQSLRQLLDTLKQGSQLR